MPDMQAATELEVYIANDGRLYEQITSSILKVLAAKKARGVYRHDLAVKGFGYLVEAGAKKYAQEFGSSPWHKMFDVSTRKRVAEELARDFEGVYASGGYDNLPKKYQKAGPSRHARKKAATFDTSAKAQTARSKRLKAIEARRQAATTEQESISSASSGVSARDIWEFSGFLRNASDRQLQGIFDKEKRAGRDEYVEATRDEAGRRGVDLEGGGGNDHARRKQIAREVEAVVGKVPSFRGR